MAKILTSEELAALASYEKEMRYAKADVLVPLPRDGQELMRSIYHRVTGEEYSQTDACGKCQLNLLRYIIRWQADTLAAKADEVMAKAEKKPVKKTTKK